MTQLRVLMHSHQGVADSKISLSCNTAKDTTTTFHEEPSDLGDTTRDVLDDTAVLHHNDSMLVMLVAVNN